MENTETILEGNSDQEKGAYLVAIASIATADQHASEEEIQNLTMLCEAAQLSAEQTERVMNAARDTEGSELTSSLDTLKNSELRFSLVADLIAFAKSDSNYSEAEQQSVTKISDYLGLNQEQFSALNQVADQTSTAQTGANTQSAGLFGMEDKLKNAGINGSTLLKGLLAVAAPLLLSKIAGRRSSGGMFGGNRGGGMFGGSGGGGLLGSLGGGGGLLGGLAGGGLGSIIGMFNGNSGFGNAGSMLGKIFGKR